ncbi:MAG: sugar MFS transporter [Burkholderiaceae bacterium]|nr:sugar MFS transporter [Burkholderiaceae bacterium]
MPHPVATRAVVPVARPRISYRAAACVVTSVFFILGFITTLNDILVPHLRTAFTLTYTQAMLVQFTFFGAYLVVSLPAGKVVMRWGYQGALVIGLLLSATGAVLFYPAASAQSYPMFLAALFVLASGIVIQQVAFNPFMSLLGPAETAASRMSLAHAFNSLGTTVAPAFGGLLILTRAPLTPEATSALPQQALEAYRLTEAHAVQGPYLGIACVLVLIAVVLRCWPMPDFVREARASGTSSGMFAPLRRQHLRLAVVAIFFYVGAEVAIGSFMVNYLARSDMGGFSHTHAAYALSLYWGGAMIGRFVGAGLLRRIAPGRLLGTFAVCAGLLVLTSALGQGWLAIVAIIAVGLFNSIMFPTIFSLGVADLKGLTPQASSLIGLAIVGGAIVPLTQGVIADHWGLKLALTVPIICYGYIAYFGFKGSKPRASDALP